jgi:fructokinase
MGHLMLQRQPQDSVRSTCSYHENCAEGLVAGPAISTRFGQALSAFSPYGPEYKLVSDYLGQLCAALVLTLSPQRIVMGGGVGKAAGLLEQVHGAMLARLGLYASYGLTDPGFITQPELGDQAGLVGALCIA